MLETSVLSVGAIKIYSILTALSNRVFQIVVRGGEGKFLPPVGGSEILLGGIFFTGYRKPEEWFWWFEPFQKLKTAFCEYWTSIKIKSNMTE